MADSVENKKTDLEELCDCYDKVGIIYAVKEEQSECDPLNTMSYLVLVGDKEKVRHMKHWTVDMLIANRSFIEFENGKIVSY